MIPSTNVAAGTDAFLLTRRQLDQIGIYATTDFEAAQKVLPTTFLCFCDVTHFAAALWVLPLTYELSKIATKSMDRGKGKEQAKIRMYTIIGHALIACFLIVEVVLTTIGDERSRHSYQVALCTYIMQVITLVYMGVVLFRLKSKGRDVESINGQFEASPVYQRIKRIMFAYALFALQYKFTSLFMYRFVPRNEAAINFIGISQIMYNATGFALALCTGCSLPCTIRLCGCCIPDEMLVQLVIGPNRLEACCVHHCNESVAPPVLNPVFVFTDIESSSALWAIGDAKLMQRAIQIHDDTLRALLTPYRGYEITTAGDSFQLAFHTIQEAVSYCLEVQLQLLAVKWPKELHGIIPSTKKQRVGHRIIFRGLRVRMGIHDAMGSDGHLHQSTHAVTGKTVYTGASEAIACAVSDAGAGGQILITQRIAEWLMTNKDALSMDYSVNYLCDYLVPQVNMHVHVYEVLPEELSRRKKVFAKGQHSRILHAANRSGSISTTMADGLETPIGSPTS
ncbi:unnamed protein product [Peronospora belbahrii]|uniref:Guanylate cyclase domain-containing protein n=1 Tax=Peronospora belbahrii TaxID=622444 RepID=A0AAU9KVD1_9STRA|nr:unnamed protein product [Peronospora belbahrii]